MNPTTEDVTVLLAQLTKGNEEAGSKLIPLVYSELRRLAGGYMRHERPDHTLQPTALVHEAYLRLIGQREVQWQNRAHFFGVAAQLMRRILLNHARAHKTEKRGGHEVKIPLDQALVFTEAKSPDLLALDEALTRLTELDARQGRVVEMRFFGGLSEEEAAEVLGVSSRTVKRDWEVARAWLHNEMRKGERPRLSEE